MSGVGNMLRFLYVQLSLIPSRRITTDLFSLLRIEIKMDVQGPGSSLRLPTIWDQKERGETNP
jgi:hypothetical protein